MGKEKRKQEKHAADTEIDIPRTYWSQDRVGDQNLSLGDHDLGGVDQGTRFGDL
jgi:hypothetical protein